MRVRVIRDVTELRNFENDWTELVRDSSFSAPYHSWHWNWISWKVFADDQSYSSHRTLHVVVVEDMAGRPLAIAPLMREMTRLRGLSIWQLAFIHSPAPRRAILFRSDVSKNDVMAAIAAYLADSRRQWDTIALTSLEEEESDLALLEATLETAGLSVFRHAAFNTPYIQIGDNFQEFLQASLNRARRQSIGRKVRRLSERNFRIAEFTRPEEMPEAVELTFAVCRKSWKKAAGVDDVTRSDVIMGFFRDIAEHFAQLNQVRIWVSMLNEVPIALEFHLTDGKKLYFLMNDFDQELEKLSPGTVLLYQVIEQLHQEPITEFDFGGDAYGYKMKWATGVRRHFNLEIFSNRPYSRFLYQAKINVMPAIRKFLSRPAVLQPAEEGTTDDAK